jgi:hypothetical protein
MLMPVPSPAADLLPLLLFRRCAAAIVSLLFLLPLLLGLLLLFAAADIISTASSTAFVASVASACCCCYCSAALCISHLASTFMSLFSLLFFRFLTRGTLTYFRVLFIPAKSARN